MLVRVDESGNLDMLETLLLECAEQHQAALILAATGNGWFKEDFDEMILDLPLVCFGGIFPQVLAEGRRLDQGTVVIGIDFVPHIQTTQLTHRLRFDCEHAMGKPQGSHTLLAFTDIDAPGAEAFMSELMSAHGMDCNYMGGCAGGEESAEPCVITPEGLMSEVALMAWVGTSSGLGVSSGWEMISGPHTGVGLSAGRLRDIDGRPAYEVYRTMLERCGVSLPETPAQGMLRLDEIGKRYPIVTRGPGGWNQVSEVFAVYEDGSLSCSGIGYLEDAEHFYVMQGHHQQSTLGGIAASKLTHTFSSFASAESLSLVFGSMLDDAAHGSAFGLEIAMAASHNRPMVGALTLGAWGPSADDPNKRPQQAIFSQLCS